MTVEKVPNKFADFLDANYGCLIQALGDALGTPLEVRDANDLPLLGSHSLDTPVEEKDLTLSLLIQAPILSDDLLMGFIVAPSGAHDLSSLLNALADQIAAHYEVTQCHDDWEEETRAA
jgi:hypothetical protein